MRFGGDFFDGGADGRDVVQDLDGVSWRCHASGGVGARKKKRLGGANRPQRALKQVILAINIFSSVWAGGGEEKRHDRLTTLQSTL